MILVIGATGLVGGRIARRLLVRGREVRVLVRPGPTYRLLIEGGADPVPGDLKDPASLALACRGVEAVITTASAGPREGADNAWTVDLEGNRNLIDAAKRAGVRHFVFVSALVARPGSPVPLLRAKAATEAYLRESGIPYTILAANGLMDVMLPVIVDGPVRSGRPVTLVGEGRRKHSLLAADDLAAVAVAVLGRMAAMERRLEIGGPEAVSWRDVVAAYERALGRPIEVRSIGPGTLLPDLPPVPGLAEFLSAVLAEMESFDSPVDMSEVVRTFAVRLTPLEEFVQRDAMTIPLAHN